MNSVIEKLTKEIEECRKINRRHFMGGGLLLASTVAVSCKGVSPELPIETETAAVKGLQVPWVSHYTYVAPDMKETRDWYHEVFGMQIGKEEGNEAHLWYGDAGSNTLMIVRQANEGEDAPRLERFAFVVEPWDKAAIEAAFDRLGIDATPESDKGYWFNDLDGNEIGVFARDYIERPAAPEDDPAVWKTLSSNHIVVTSNDYRALGDWYSQLFDLRETIDSGRDTYQWFGDSVWIPTAVGEGEQTSAVLQSLDHVAYTIANYVSSEVEDELRRRGLIEADADVTGSLGINCVDINGWHTQVCAANLVPDAEAKLNG